MSAHPFVRFLYEEAARQGVPMLEVTDRAGIARSCPARWKSEGSPNLVNIEAALGAVGFALALVPVGEPRGRGKAIGGSRKEARRLGLRFYQPAAPCGHGHNAIRYASNNACVDCLREANQRRGFR